jgi:Cu(I)/Ag(I) efflux system membrane fusion protein
MSTQITSRRSLVTSITFAAALVALAAIFHRPLTAWFTGKSMGGREGAAVTAHAGPFTLSAALDPDPPGTSGDALAVVVTDANGKPVDDASLGLLWDMPAMGAMAEMKGKGKVTHSSGGRYRAEFDVPMVGGWTLRATIASPIGRAAQDFTMTVGSRGLTIAGEASTQVTSARVGTQTYPEPVLDALRGGVDAYERAQERLAKDETEGVADDARALAEALRAAAGAMPPDLDDARRAASSAADDAGRLARAATLEEARAAFADTSRTLLAVVAADARLTSDAHLFQCPMIATHPRWMQRGATPENPYLGTQMVACGTAQTWRPPAATAASMASSGEETEAPVVRIDDARRQLIGVRTAKVVEAPMRESFRAIGRVAYDESKLTDVSLKVRGWVTKLFIDETGQRVARGQPLFTLYSPEIYNAEQDFLLATRSAAGALALDGGPGRVAFLATAARERLHLLGLDEAEIDAIAKNGAPSESVTFNAPATGFVIEKNLVEGGAVDAGMRLYRIAALDRVWVEAEVYEADLAHVKVGQLAHVTLDYLPGRSYEAKVAYVYPYLDPAARTGRVRIELANKGLALRPGMYATVTLSSDLGTRIQVPAGAVVYTGPRRIVFVDLGQGRFRVQETKVGTESDGMYEVLSGLKPGESVATSGVFLIAAEARLSTAAKYWASGAEDAGAAMDGAR